MTSTFNPILSREAIVPWNLLAARPEPEPGIALVLVRDGRPRLAIWSDDKVTLGQVRWGNYHSVYRVDVSEHILSLRCALPSLNVGFEFQADVSVAYWVNDPLVIVQRRITDARAVVEPLLIRHMRMASRDFAPEEWALAEEAVGDAINQHATLADFAITRSVVNLSIEEDERAHARKMRELQREHEYSMHSARCREEFNALYTRLQQQSLAFYQQIASPGYEQLLMLDIANHPERMGDGLKSINQQIERERDHWHRMFNTLREADGLEPADLDKMREFVLKQFAESEQKLRVSRDAASLPAEPALQERSVGAPR